TWIWADVTPPHTTLQKWLRSDPPPDWQGVCAMGAQLVEQLAAGAGTHQLEVVSTDPDKIPLIEDDGRLRAALPFAPLEQLRTGRAPDDASGRTPGRWDAPEVADGA